MMNSPIQESQEIDSDKRAAQRKRYESIMAAVKFLVDDHTTTETAETVIEFLKQRPEYQDAGE